jgi:toxin FitB
MNVVDSSGSLEYFADCKSADFFSAAIEDTENLIVPIISLYEVFKRVTQQADESQSLQAIALMQQGKCVDLNPELAIYAGTLSIQYKLPMADGIFWRRLIALKEYRKRNASGAVCDDPRIAVGPGVLTEL